MIMLDGAEGEGGGQILRTALALSLRTGTPFRIDRIRAGRARPGLMRQHLTAVEAAATVGEATVSGAEIGSPSLVFRPKSVRGGAFSFSVGTAGSATLVLQTVLPALITAQAASTLHLEGGTHNPFSPPFDFLQRAYLPLLQQMGPIVVASLQRPGFYPAGGGRFDVSVEPVAALKPLTIETRGALTQGSARIIVANLPRVIAEREITRLSERLGWEATAFSIEHRGDALGPGNAIIVEIASEHVTEVFSAFGEKRVRAEAVADQVADEVLAYLASDVPVGVHLADQLLLLMAIAGRGSFRTLAPSTHTTTQLSVIPRFLEVQIRHAEESPGVWRFTVG